MKIRYTPRAIANLEAMADHLEPLNPSALRKIKAAILESLAYIAQFPEIGRANPRRSSQACCQ